MILQCRHLINPCTKCVGSPGIILPNATQFLGHGCMDDLTLNVFFYSQATCIICVLGLFVDMLSIWVFVQPGSAVKCLCVCGEGGGGGGGFVCLYNVVFKLKAIKYGILVTVTAGCSLGALLVAK